MGAVLDDFAAKAPSDLAVAQVDALDAADGKLVQLGLAQSREAGDDGGARPGDDRQEGSVVATVKEIGPHPRSGQGVDDRRRAQQPALCDTDTVHGLQ